MIVSVWVTQYIYFKMIIYKNINYHEYDELNVEMADIIDEDMMNEIMDNNDNGYGM